jgi:MYXO-CTERM domain-containing protein
MMLHHEPAIESHTRSLGSKVWRVAVAIVTVILGTLFVQPASAEMIYALASQGGNSAIVRFDSTAPGTLLQVVASDTFEGIDFRPSTGGLYVFNTGTGVSGAIVSELNPVSLQPGLGYSVKAPAGGFNGFNWGFEINPVTNQAQIVSETGQNIGAINLFPGPPSGTQFPDVAYAAGDPNFGIHPNVVDLAFSNNVPNASSTTLYGIDTGLDVLVTVNPTTGALTTVGSLGIDVNAAGGFDISRFTGIAYAALLPSNKSNSSLYTINLATGAATAIGQIDGGIIITGMTVAPEPASAALVVIAVLGAAGIRRRS